MTAPNRRRSDSALLGPSESALTLVSGPVPDDPRIASSLSLARRGELLHVDETGQVRSAGRYRLMQAAGWAWTGLLGLGAATLSVLAFGTLSFWTLAAPLAFGVAVGVDTARRNRLLRASALIAQSRLVEAETMCRELLSERWVSREHRATALQNLSVAVWRRGRLEEALVHLRAAIRERHSAFGRGVSSRILAYMEVLLLVALERVGEARGRLRVRGPIPEGDYLRLLHYQADTAVQFGEGRLQLDEDELWARGRMALEVNQAPALLALCAWGFERLGDREMSRHLLDEAWERKEPESEASFPALWRWVDEARGHQEPEPDEGESAAG